jgi:hypothetical protein
MLFKIIVVIVLIIILYCLISAVYYLLYRKDPTHMAKALTWRIILSVCLFILLFIAYALGWITPHGIIPYNQ